MMAAFATGVRHFVIDDGLQQMVSEGVIETRPATRFTDYALIEQLTQCIQHFMLGPTADLLRRFNIESGAQHRGDFS